MSSFSIIQYLLVFIVTFIVAIDQFSFLESLYQPIVVGPVIGAILGDMKTGLVVGGTYQLIQIGSMPVGGEHNHQTQLLVGSWQQSLQFPCQVLIQVPLWGWRFHLHF